MPDDSGLCEGCLRRTAYWDAQAALEDRRAAREAAAWACLALLILIVLLAARAGSLDRAAGWFDRIVTRHLEEG